jgi:hypothetical protein
MNKKAQERFIYSAAIIFFVTATAKLLSTRSTALALDVHDPILLLTHRHVFYLIGGIELGLSAFLLMGQNQRMKLALTAWLATNFLVYRIGLWWGDEPNLCNCLGNLAGYVPLSPWVVNAAAFAALSWLVIGSYLFLLLDWLHGRRKASSQPGITRPLIQKAV